MFNKKEFSKIYLVGFFLLLLIISFFAVLIFEKTTNDNNEKTIILNLETEDIKYINIYYTFLNI